MKLLRYFRGFEANIVEILDVMVSPNRRDFNDVYIVTNLMETSLRNVIMSGQPLEETHYKYGARVVCKLPCDFRTRALVRGRRCSTAVPLLWGCSSTAQITDGGVAIEDVSCGCGFGRCVALPRVQVLHLSNASRAEAGALCQRTCVWTDEDRVRACGLSR